MEIWWQLAGWVLFAIILAGIFGAPVGFGGGGGGGGSKAHRSGGAPWDLFGPGLAHTLLTILEFLLWALAIGLVLMALSIALRIYMRRRRMEAMRVEEIILGPDDTATPYEVMSALDAIHGQLLTRYAGSSMGQNPWSFEIVRDQDGGIHFLLSAPYQWLAAIEDIWRSKYTNIRFKPWGDAIRPWPVAQQIVLTKDWQHATETQKDYANSVVETIVQGLDRADGEVHLQYLMTPLPPSSYHAKLREKIRSLEYQARQQQIADPASSGVGSVENQIVKDSLQLFGKAVYQTEIRLAADSWGDMQRVYGSLTEANGENTFRAATVWMAKDLWTKWLYARMPSLFMFGSSTMFSFPLATLVHLPTARLRVNSLNRSLIRRGPANKSVPRDESLAILRDESGLVGIPEGDRKYNVLLVGSQGSGKTTDLLNIIKVDSRYGGRYHPGKALVLIDIGKDTAKRALGIVPPDKKVIWYDPADPNCPWSINPMLASVNDSVLADNVLESLTEVFGDEAIRARSREFLGNAILAIRDVKGDEADFTQVYQMLTDEAFRNEIIQNVRDSHQKKYWQVTFTNAMAKNPRFIEEGLAAPRNKLDEPLRNPLIRATMESGTGRQQIDFREIIQGRAVFIANLDKSKLGKEGARLLGIMLINMLWHALQTQTDIPEDERVPVSLILDEAQNFISEGFLDILAEGRAYGVQVTAAVRFLQEIDSEKVIKGLQALAQNLIVHQFELLEEAEVFMKRFMRVFANMITTSDESQDALNFGADDFMRLPKYHAVCRFMVNGTPQPAFLAQTIPWEKAYDERVKDGHLADQPRAKAPSTAQAPSIIRVVPPPQTEETPFLFVQPEVPAQTPPLLSVRSAPAPGPSSSGGPATDPLTGLLSRSAWDKAVTDVSGEGHMVMVVALDEPTDDLARRGAAMLRGLLGMEDLAGRTGGDEFSVLVPNSTKDTLVSFGKQVRQMFQVAKIGGSIGAVIQRPGEAPGEAYRRAEQAARREQQGKTGRKPAPAPASAVNSPASEGPEKWGENDSRKVLCEKYGFVPAQLLAMAQKIGATDPELQYAASWILKNHIPSDTVRFRLPKILQMKVEDRILMPVAELLNTDLKKVREAVLAADGTAEQANRLVREDPSIQTMDQLQTALRRGKAV